MYNIGTLLYSWKLSQIDEKYNFHGENFRHLLASAVPKDATPQILWRKLVTVSLIYNYSCCDFNTMVWCSSYNCALHKILIHKHALVS